MWNPTDLQYIFYTVLWLTNAQLFHKLSHSYMYVLYIPDQHESSINIQTVYTATT